MPNARLRLVFGSLVVLAACSSSSSDGPVDAGSSTPPPLVNEAGAPLPMPDAGDDAGVATCPSPVTITHSDAGAVSTASYVFLDGSDPNAVCNDGSPGAYLFRPGVGAAAKRWIIDLEGGGACFTDADCLDRAHNSQLLVSSKPRLHASQADIDAEANGLLSPDPKVSPDFYDATIVKIFYCSSDAWSGAKKATAAFDPRNASQTWSFQGRAIEAAVIADITRNHGFGDAAEVLFIGHSAGAQGVYLTVNDMVDLVPKTARFVASGDAAFNIDVTSFDPAAPPNYTSSDVPRRSTVLPGAMQLWGGRGDRHCDARTTTVEQKIDCYSPQALVTSGDIALPMYVAQAQADHVQISGDGAPDDNAAPTLAYTKWFASQMHPVLLGLPAPFSVFAPATRAHTLATGDGLFNATVTFPGATTSDRAALGAWYADPCTPRRYVADLAE